jgi:catechol 2,3-dioxygenase-like lactoylglutathione lyase family enzyme
MIDHLILNVSDLAASRAFYEKALAPLGFKVVMEFPQGVAFGQVKPELGLAEREPVHTGVHLAFTSPDRPTVEAFYRSALEGGGKDNGPPGLRPHYHPDYYGAFVLDPDGNNIEAVCHQPE